MGMVLYPIIGMDTHYSILIALQENLPEEYSEENLHLLEQLVTRYQEILEHIAHTADPENHTLFYRERMYFLEKQLKDAKYGHDEKRRVAAFVQAKESINEAITALLYHLNHDTANEV